jgi:glycosyltransferase involved in cell wall biosynthesis
VRSMRRVRSSPMVSLAIGVRASCIVDMLTLSIVITTHNEGQSYLSPLLTGLCAIAREQPSDFEIVVVDDYSDDPSTVEVLQRFRSDTRFSQHALNRDFAAHKNFANAQCSGEWILQLDGDEYLEPAIIIGLPYVLALNPLVDAYRLARVNTLTDLTPADVRAYGWKLTVLDGYPLPVVNFPDPQLRLYRNQPTIRWVSKLHESITGCTRIGSLPAMPQYAIQHHKALDRQVRQIEFYDEIYRHHMSARRQM